MAEETDIPLRITVDGAQAGKTLGEVRQEVKDLTIELNKSVEGSKKFNDTLIKLGGAKATLMDLRENIKALDPQETARAFTKLGQGITSGFQLATGAAALFGVESKDIQATLLKVQAASALAQGVQGIQGLGKSFQQLGLILKANPLLLIATIIIGVGTALFALKDKVKIIGDAFDFLGNIIGGVVQGFKDFTDAIGITSFKADELSKKTLDNAKKEGEALLIRYDREIALAQAAGKEVFDIEKRKHDAIIENIRTQLSALEFNRIINKGLTDEEEKLHAELLKQAENTFFEKQETVTKEVKSNKDKLDKIATDNQKAKDKEKEEYDKAFAQFLLDKAEGFELLKAEAIEEAEWQAAFDKGVADEKTKTDEENAAKEEALAKRVADTKKQLGRDAFNAAKNLSDTLFANALLGAKGNAAKEREIKKRQFNLNKGIAAVETAINTAQAIIKSLAQIPPPAGIPFAVAMGVIGAVNIAAILAKKFPEGDAAPADSGGGAPNLGGGGGGGGGGTPAAPTFQPTITGTQTTAAGDFTGFNQQPIRAYVVENDISDSQKRVSTLQERASF